MSGPRDMRRAARTGLAVAISVAWVAAGSPLRAEPTNPVIVGDSAGLGAGAATIGSVSNGPGTDMTIDQHAERVFIDWASFNIGASDSVSFQQGGSQWIAVNRVTGGLGPTTIDGMLTANGHVWIIDPAGIAFSSTAVVDVGGLLATASNIDPGDFLAVTDLEDETGFSFAFGGNDGARVSNAGTINSSGLLAMVAPLVDNSGTLESTYGDVLLGGANAFRLSFTQVERPADADHQTAFDELLVTDFIIETPVTNDPVPGNETVPVTNTGNLTGANVIVSAASAGGGAFINMDGVVEATSIGDQSGDVVILGGGDFTDGAADAASSGSEAIRIENADITAAGDFVAQGTGVSIEKGTGPGTITAGSSRIAATSGDVTSDTNLTTTGGGMDISASGLVSVAALDASTTIDIEAADVDLGGGVVAGSTIAMEATAGDISGTDIDIEGASVELTGQVTATDSASIVATTGNATLNDDMTSTGSILIGAASGKVTAAGLDADTTLSVTAGDIDLNGTVTGGGAVTVEATAGDISGTDIDIEGASVELTGPVTATDSAAIVATTGDATLNDDMTSTGSILIEATEGKVTTAGLDADTTLDITADDIEVTDVATAGGALAMIAELLDIDLQGAVEAASVYLEAARDIMAVDSITATSGAIEIEAGGEVDLVSLDAATTIDVTAAALEVSGDASASGDATFRAMTGDATFGGKTSSANGDVLIEAKLGHATAEDIESKLDTTIVAGAVSVLGDIVSMGQVALQALTGNVDVQGSVTANGGLLLLEAGQGDAIINRIASLTNVSILALDLDLSGSISAGDEVQLTSLDSGTTVVLGGDGGTGTVVLRNPAGLTIDADELSRISTGKLRIDAEANDALLLDVDFTGATLGDLSVGADNSSQIIAAGSVQGLDALTLGYVDGADDRRPGLIVVPGELGQDTTTGRLGAVTLNSSQDIIIGPQAFQAFYQADDPSLASLGKLNPAAFKATRNHIFIAADDLKLYAPGEIVQLNTGSGVDGRGIVFKVAAVDEGVVNPSGDGPEKVVLFGVIIRDDGARVTSYSAGLEPRILFPGTTDANGNVIEEPLEKSTDYRFNLCIIGDPVSCSNALLREAEPTAGVAGSDPNPYVAGPDLSFDDDDDDLDGEGDLGGVAATGNESLWGAGVR
ncbi:MAG: filamentous hemagglutinin N-terminal domain-containing protein [Parvibaculum sp.]